jgi:hypothetical protein
MSNVRPHSQAMLQYRITKYNPAHRDAAGAYLAEEWTSHSEIGQSFGNVAFTSDDYQAVEDAYVAVAEAFLQEAGVTDLAVAGLEAHGDEPHVFEGERLTVQQVGSVVRALLRERFWCRLEGAGAFVHVGYDYYMYVGVSRECPRASAAAKAHKLYVEKFASPYAQSAA